MEKQMTDTFIHMLNISYQAGITVFIVIAARMILSIIHAPKKYSYILWLIPFIRLAIPIQLESVFSLLPGQSEPIPSAITLMERPAIQTNSNLINRVVNQSLPSATPYASVNPMQIWMFLLSAVWLTGLIFLIVYSVGSVVHLKAKLRMSVHENANIYSADGISTAFVLGWYRPRIYLPSSLPKDLRSYVICHEQQHIKRKDHIAKLLFFAVVCVYWFHPLVWLAFYLLKKDMEFACDEAVIQGGDESGRKKYAAALLELTCDKKALGTIPLAFSEAGPKKRIKNIMRYKKPIFFVKAAGVLLIVVLVLTLLTNQEEKQDNEKKEPKISEETSGKRIEITVPPVNPAAMTGADGARLYYADENQIVFGGYFGLFVYSKKDRNIIRALDLEAIGCSDTQGDAYCEIFALKDGTKVFLHPMNEKDMYIYDIPADKLTRARYDLEHMALFDGMNQDGWSASFVENGKTKNCTIVQYATIGSIGYYEDNGPIHKFFIPDEFRNAVNFEPEEIYDLKKIEMYIDGTIVSTEDSKALEWVERQFSQNVKMSAAPACSFSDAMYLTRSDGQIGIIYPATDSCLVFRTEKGYFSFSEGDNSEFWSLFDGWNEKLPEGLKYTEINFQKV